MDGAEHLLNSFCTLMNSFYSRSLEKLVDAVLGRYMNPASGPDEPKASREIFRFEDFELDRYQLHRAGLPVRLQRLPLELLYFLVERRGELVTREEIIERLWGKSVFVDSENSINTAVRKIRQALNDDSDAPRFIITVPARGSRLARRWSCSPCISRRARQPRRFPRRRVRLFHCPTSPRLRYCRLPT